MAGQPKPPSLTYPFSAVEGFHSRPRMAKPPNLTGEGVAWPDVVALQAQVRSKETSSGRYGRVALRLGCDCFGIWEFVGWFLLVNQLISTTPGFMGRNAIICCRRLQNSTAWIRLHAFLFSFASWVMMYYGCGRHHDGCDCCLELKVGAIVSLKLNFIMSTDLCSSTTAHLDWHKNNKNIGNMEMPQKKRNT